MKSPSLLPSLCLTVLSLLTASNITHGQVRPQDDFYTFINAEWLEKTPIPEALPGLENFTDLTLKVSAQLRDDLDALGQDGKPLAPHEQKLADLYRSFIDLERRNELGVKPLEPELKMIADVKDHKGVGIAIAEFQKLGVGGPFLHIILADPMNSIQHTLIVRQWGLTLTQEVLAGDDERSRKMRKLYQEHITNMLALIGIPDGEQRAQRLVELEQKLGKIQWTRTENRDPQKTYNVFTSAQLAETLSNFPVKEMHVVLGIPADISMVVEQPSYLEALNQLIPEIEVEVWQDFLRMRMLSQRAVLLGQPFQEESSSYQQKQGLSTKDLEEWLKAVSFLGEEVSMLLGRFYVERHVSKGDQEQINELVRVIKEEYRSAITGNTLFSEATRKEAEEKLGRMRFQVGYPEVWKDYSALKTDPGDLVGNVRRVALFDHENMLAKLDARVDPDEWIRTPSMVNAYYQPSSNKFVLLAAILQPPFFDAEWSDATQLGGIGFIIGHEIGHGFDDQGSQYDADGNLRNWWTQEDRAKFNAVAQRAIEQANAYQVQGYNLKGELEIGEILGDLNGLHIAHRACLRIAKEQGVEPQQASREFFAQAAKVWRSKFRESLVPQLIATDNHPPGEYRVNGIFPHLDAFHDLYQTEPGDGMYLAPENRLKIW